MCVLESGEDNAYLKACSLLVHTFPIRSWSPLLHQRRLIMPYLRVIATGPFTTVKGPTGRRGDHVEACAAASSSVPSRSAGCGSAAQTCL